MLGFAVIFVVSCFAGYNSYIGSRGGRERAGDAVATVNGIPITTAEFYTRFKSKYDQAEQSQGGMSALEDAETKGMILSDLVNGQILASAAEHEGIEIGWWELRRERGKMINEQIEQIRQQVGQGRKKKLSDEEFNKILSRLQPPTSISSLRSQISKELTPSEAKKQLMIRKLDEKLRASIGKIDGKQVTESFRRLKTRQIVISTASRSVPRS